MIASQQFKRLLKKEGNRCTDLIMKVKECPFAEGSKITHVLELFILKAIEVLKMYLRDATYVNGSDK